MKLWAMHQAGLIESYDFELDLHGEVFEACAYHRWGLFESSAKGLATFILGGGVPKNYNLQPEPGLGQVLGLPNIRGYPIRCSNHYSAGCGWIALFVSANRGCDMGQG